MTVGRYSMRGWAFQPWAFAGYTLANSGAGPVVVSVSSGIESAFRSRTAAAGCRSRTDIAAFRSRTVTVERPIQ